MTNKSHLSPFGPGSSLSNMTIEQIFAMTNLYHGQSFSVASSQKEYSYDLLALVSKEFERICSSLFVPRDAKNDPTENTRLSAVMGDYGEDTKYIFRVSANHHRVNNKDYLLIALTKNSDRLDVDHFTISAAGNLSDDINSLFSLFLAPFLIPPEIDQQKIGVVLGSATGMYIKTAKLDRIDVNVAINYGEDFAIKKHQKIVDKLNSGHSGLYLFHGIPGSGKTTYIRYLTQLVSNRLFIFIPSNYISCITDPKFLSLLMEYKNPILILEDAERAVETRETNLDSSLVSNILNLSNGLLGSVFNTSIIVTFNTGKEQIDKALKRKGRLMAEHQFNMLSPAESEAVFKSLGKNIKPTSSLSLAEIYNNDDEDYQQMDCRPKIGF